ncbi:MAG: TauD/TfdA family dioxygenase [Acidiferrobacterales bacterium]
MPTNSAPTGKETVSPFSLREDVTYEHWREKKLENYPASIDTLTVEIKDAPRPSTAEIAELSRICSRYNMAVYVTAEGENEDRSILRNIGTALGLTRLDPNMLADEDGITSLAVVEGKSGRGYIPYSNRRLLWHTDGYYNLSQHRIRAMLLHCVRPAVLGGENSLMDAEIAYILLRDANPEYVEALMQPDAMTIPANMETGQEIREARCGPVFSIDPVTGDLHMRYTARTRSIEWKDDEITRQAVRFIEKILSSGSGYLMQNSLAAGQGLVCNNVLHNRSEFEDSDDGTQQRLVFRARYYDRIANTRWQRTLEPES